jgi:CHC2 zinc finger
MSRRHFDSTENVELRAKIDEAKRRLRLPQLLERLGLGAHAKKSARCPFPGHDDKRPSFSVFQGEDGFWHYNCFSSCGSGDEIMFLRKLKGLSLTKAMNLYLEMAGFPAQRPKSREYPELPKPPKPLGSPQSLRLSESPCVSVYPVSNGQGLDKELETELKGLAARNACTERNTATTRRFKLLRDLKKVEKQIGRELTIAERRLTCKEWHRLSQPSLDPQKTFDDYFARFLSERRKVRFATGEGVLRNALETSQNSQSLICR